MITRKFIKRTLALTTGLALNLLPFSQLIAGASAASLTTSSLTISDSRPSTTSVTYTTDFSGITLSTIKCIQLVFSTATTSGTIPPSGMSTSSAAYSAAASDYVPDVQTWTADVSSNGTVKLTNATGEIPGSASGGTIALTGITNASTAETPYYIQFSTYNNVNCSSSPVDSGTASFIFTTGQAVSVSVDPSLAFTIDAVASGQAVNGATTTVTTTDGTIPFGTVTTGANAIGAHDLTVTTNAGSGYTVYTRYTQAPTSGANSIDDWTGTNATPTTFSAAGTEAFGYTSNDAVLGTGTAARFTTGAPKWAKFTTSNLEVAYSGANVASEVTRIGYQVGIAGTTPAGTYNNSTIIFTATPAY